jgi:hypothetical protein
MVHGTNPEVHLPDMKRRASLAGAPTKLSVVEVEDPETGEITYKLVSSIHKFDQEAKNIVISELANHGRIGTAARAAGVTIKTVKVHVKKDVEFAEMIMEATEVYKDKLINHHQKLVFDGTKKEHYDRNGKLVSTETVYPIPLIQMELRKHDEGYRDKREVSLDVRGGVLVAPSETKSIDDWEAKFGPQGGELVEGTLADSKSDGDSNSED